MEEINQHKTTYEIEIARCFFPMNKKYNGRFKFSLYRDNFTPYFESGCIYKTKHSAKKSALNLFFKDKNKQDYIIEEYENSIILKPKNIWN